MALTRSNDRASLFSPDVAGTIQLMVYLALACGLMLADHHFGMLQRARQVSAVIAEPVFMAAALPAKIAHGMDAALTDRRTLRKENRQLRESLLLAEARIDRLRRLGAQNRRYRQLLAVQDQLDFKVQTARLVGVDLGRYRHRVLIGAGADQGISVGMTIMDARGVMGQVVEVGKNTAQVMLITDPEHDIPVVVERTGLRLIARGTGRRDDLRVGAIPLSADIRVDDRLITSGLGGQFPAGFPVARVTAVKVGVDGMFKVADATPAADLGRSTEVLVLRPHATAMGPPAPAPAFGPPVSPEAARDGASGAQ